MVKQIADNFAKPLKEIIQNIPEDTVTSEIRLADWSNIQWDNHHGRVTLAGDAAHAMTMCNCFPHTYPDTS